ncbi:MAG: hypothetical protein VST67_14795 [Nitrospirota bacterium]|nr:hypothetical protein [Nitrospirota bacterium]
MKQKFTRDNLERKRAEEALQKAHAELEMQVQERTADLRATNELLQKEITERKWTEDALRESEERFRKIFEEGPLGMAIVGQDFRFIEGHGKITGGKRLSLI